MSARADLRWIEGRVETVVTEVHSGCVLELPGRVLLEDVTLDEAVREFAPAPIRVVVN